MHERGMPSAEARRESLHGHQSGDHHVRREAQPRRPGSSEQRARYGRACRAASHSSYVVARPRASLWEANAWRVWPGYGTQGPWHGDAEGRRCVHPCTDHHELGEGEWRSPTRLGWVPLADDVTAEARAGRLQRCPAFVFVSTKHGPCWFGPALISIS